MVKQMAKKEDDLILSIIGKFGKFQLRSVLIIYLVKIPSAWFMVSDWNILVTVDQKFKLLFRPASYFQRHTYGLEKCSVHPG